MKKILYVFVAVVLLVGAFYCYGYWNRQRLLRNLKGEIVFSKRNKGILNICKCKANGKDLKILYRHSDPVNSNAMFSSWSADGSKIYFAAFHENGWKQYEMNSEGGDVKIIDGVEPSTVSRTERCSDILVRQGSIYYVDEKGIKHLVYKHWYQPEFNRGASETSWSPDKKYIIFEKWQIFRGSRIFVVNKEGTELVMLTDGTQPDWKN